jgi:lysozyme
MSDLAALQQQLRRHEGIRLKPYTDTVGKLTIGIGRNLADRGISDDEAEYLLTNDIALVLDGLSRYDWFLPLNDVRQNVLLNMGFNMGVPRLLVFMRLISALRAGDYWRAAVEMLDSQWAKQVGSRAVELANQMRTGEAI